MSKESWERVCKVGSKAGKGKLLCGKREIYRGWWEQRLKLGEGWQRDKAAELSYIEIFCSGAFYLQNPPIWVLSDIYIDIYTD